MYDRTGFNFLLVSETFFPIGVYYSLSRFTKPHFALTQYDPIDKEDGLIAEEDRVGILVGISDRRCRLCYDDKFISERRMMEIIEEIRKELGAKTVQLVE